MFACGTYPTSSELVIGRPLWSEADIRAMERERQFLTLSRRSGCATNFAIRAQSRPCAARPGATLASTCGSSLEGVSQPSLTGCIKRLQKEIGGQLFARMPTVSGTPLGNAVMPHFRRIARDAEKGFVIGGFARWRWQPLSSRKPPCCQRRTDTFHLPRSV